MRPTFAALLTILAVVARAAGPEFDAASIKPSAPAGNGRILVRCDGGTGSSDPVSFTCHNMSLSNLITNAYGLQPYSAPAWLDAERFDINAKLPEGTPGEDFLLMQRNLLSQRFALVVHREKKEMFAYDLVVMKNGPKFKETIQPAPSPKNPPSVPMQIKKDQDGFPILPPGRPGMIMIPGRARWQAVGQTMEQLANMLSAQAGAPVRDATGLAGKFDFTPSWNPDGMRAKDGEALAALKPGIDSPAVGPDADTAPTLFDAIQQQLGLRLEKKRSSVDILIVDHVEKTPTAN
jgi:uncharacterized protein (TIGR03435 family)